MLSSRHGSLTEHSRSRYASCHHDVVGRITTDVAQSDGSWRLPSLLQAICSIVILFFIFFMPESLRWLCNKDRHEEALHIFAHWYGEGNENDEFIQLEYTEVKAAIELDKESGKTGWSHFFKTPGNRKRITIITAIGFFSQWSGNGLISYYLKYVMDNVGMTDPQTQLGINGGMKTLALCENFFFAFFIDKLGRRPIYLISTIGTFVVFNIFTIISALYEIAALEKASSSPSFSTVSSTTSSPVSWLPIPLRSCLTDFVPRVLYG